MIARLGALFGGPLFLQWIRRSVAMGIPSMVCDHIDIRVGASVLPVACADFEYPCRRIRFVHKMVTIRITTPERDAVAGAEGFFPRVGNQCQFSIEHPDEFVLLAMPVTLTGPCPGLDDRYVHAELCQPRKTCQSLTGLSDARLIEGRRIGSPRLRRNSGNVDFFHSVKVR